MMYEIQVRGIKAVEPTKICKDNKVKKLSFDCAKVCTVIQRTILKAGLANFVQAT